MRRLFMISFVAMLIVLLSTANVAMVSGETNEMKYAAAAVELHADGSYTPDTAFLYSVGIKDDLLLSPDKNFRMQLPESYQEIGLHDVFYDEVRQSWRVSFTSIVEAPLLNIWTDSERTRDDGSIRLSKSETGIKGAPTAAARSDSPMGLEFLYGDTSYLLENDTDDSGALWEYTTDFALSSYNILYLDDVGDYGAANLSITVSYVEALTYTDLSSTYARNFTIFNEPVDGYKDLWFRLDLENTNPSFDEYVAHIEIDNFDIRGGKYILDVDANTTDTRYRDNYIGSLTSALSVSSEDRFASHVGPHLRSQNAAGLGLLGWFDSLSSSDILGSISSFTGLSSDSVAEARGWNSATDLEDSLRLNIVDKSDSDSIDDITEVKDLSLTDAIMNWKLPSSLTDVVSGVVDNAVDLYDTVGDVVNQVQEQAVPRVNFATSVEAPEIEGSSADADDALDLTASVVAADQDGSSNFGAGIVDDITDTLGDIADGAVSIWTGIADFGDDIAPGYGYLLPFLIAGVLLFAIVMIYSRMMM